METATPYLLLSALLAAVGGPLLTQAGKEWRWVDRWSTAINAVLGQLCAVIVWAVWGDGDRAMLGSLLIVAAGGSTAGGVGYTAIKRAGQAVRGKRQDRDAQTLSEMRRMTRRPKRQWPKPPPGGTPGLVLAVLLLAAPAAAQEVSEPRPCSWGEFCPAHVSTEATPAACAGGASLEAAETFPVATPGMSTWWCSDRICSGAGTSRISRAVPQSPPDPWAGGGRFAPTNPVSLAAWRARYSYPFTVAGSYVGAWCGQHSVCDAILAEWLARFGSRTWTAGGACLEAGDLGRAACDAIHTGGSTLGCTMLPCGVVSCPSSQRTCSVDGTCGGGWRCTPLLDLPEGERIGAVTPHGRTVRARRDTTSGSSDACSFFATAQGVLWVRQLSPCFAGMPEDCQTVASLRPECWAPPEPPPPVCGDGTCEPGEVCPEDCDPASDPTCPPCPPVDPVAEALLEAVRAVPGVCP
jgi:hypothetical protein